MDPTCRESISQSDLSAELPQRFRLEIIFSSVRGMRGETKRENGQMTRLFKICIEASGNKVHV